MISSNINLDQKLVTKGELIDGSAMNSDMYSRPAVKVLQHSRYGIQFELHGVDLSVANSLRRIMIAEVPTLSIDLVEVRENTSALHDEFVAHRLGLVPLVSDQVDAFVSSEECACQRMCPKCSVNYKLHAICASDRQQLEVTAKHVLPADPDSSVVPVAYQDDAGNEEDAITLMKLSRNQQLDMTMMAKKGIGKTHAKWSPVSTCTLRKYPLVQADFELINKRLSLAQRAEFVARCPRKVFKLNAFKQAVEIEDADRCSLCQECTRFAADAGLPSRALLLGEHDHRFLFTVESTGALAPEDIVARAFKILQTKLTFLGDALAQPRYIVH